MSDGSRHSVNQMSNMQNLKSIELVLKDSFKDKQQILPFSTVKDSSSSNDRALIEYCSN